MNNLAINKKFYVIEVKNVRGKRCIIKACDTEEQIDDFLSKTTISLPLRTAERRLPICFKLPLEGRPGLPFIHVRLARVINATKSIENYHVKYEKRESGLGRYVLYRGEIEIADLEEGDLYNY